VLDKKELEELQEELQEELIENLLEDNLQNIDLSVLD